MSAIGGILRIGGPEIAPGRIERLARGLAQRGPDGTEFHRDAAISLVHCRVGSQWNAGNADQPLRDAASGCVVVFDGRLDNRQELAVMLGVRKSVSPASDVALLLQAFLRWGVSCPSRLLGDFAFAIWEPRSGALFCARDPFGARPFHYVKRDDCFAFASVDEALLGEPGVSARPNEDLIAHLIVRDFQDFDFQDGWLRDVATLHPGTALRVQRDGRMTTAHHDPFATVAGLNAASDADIVERFQEVFESAVECRTGEHGAIAAMLSGGLDSACIAAAAHRLAVRGKGTQLTTYSAVSDDSRDCIESRSIASITTSSLAKARRVGLPSMTGHDAGDIVDLAWSQAHPVDNSILIPGLMCRMARRDGVRSLVHGVSGDTALHTPDRYIARLLRAGTWRAAWAESWAASCNHVYLRTRPPLSLLGENAIAAFAPRLLVAAVRRGQENASPSAQSGINPDFARRLRIDERIRAARWRQRREPPQTLGEEHSRLIRSRRGIMLGLGGYDRLGSRYGMELSDPWSDRRVLEFAAGLPLRMRVRDGWTKYLARVAYSDVLTSDVRWRTDKEHLGAKLTQEVMRRSREYIGQVLQDHRERLEPYTNVNELQRTAMTAGAVYDDASEMLYHLTSLALWQVRTASLATMKHGGLDRGSGER